MSDPKPSEAAAIITAVASLISALAWPVLVAFVLIALYRNSDLIGKSLDGIMQGRASAKLVLSPVGGLTLELVEKTATVSANAVIESAKKSASGPLDQTQATQVTASAQSAVKDLALNSLDPEKRLKVLWVDDHPENNIDLQFAFQALGIIVVTIDSNTLIDQSFQVSSGFDVVITDMYRDESENGQRPADPEGGLKTIDLISKDHPNIPTIIYAGAWASEHKSNKPRSSVVLISNYPSEVYQTIIDMAKKKAT